MYEVAEREWESVSGAVAGIRRFCNRLCEKQTILCIYLGSWWGRAFVRSEPYEKNEKVKVAVLISAKV